MASSAGKKRKAAGTLSDILCFPAYESCRKSTVPATVRDFVQGLRSFECKYPTCCLDEKGNRKLVCACDIGHCSACGMAICQEDASALASLGDARCPQCRDILRLDNPNHLLTRAALRLIAAKCPGCDTEVHGKAEFDHHVRTCPKMCADCTLCGESVPIADFYTHVATYHCDKKLLQKTIRVRREVVVVSDTEI